MEWLLLAVTGVVSGVAAGLLGIGGGLILVPVLIWLLDRRGLSLDIAVNMAVATALGVIVFTALSSLWAHHRRGAVRWGLVRLIAPWIALGALLGAGLAHWIGGHWVAIVFVIFALYTAWRMWHSAQFEEGDVLALRWPRSVGVGAGVISAMVGIGGGSITVPYLRWHHLPMVNAVATGAALGYPIAISSVLTYIALGWGQSFNVPSWGYVYWPGLLIIAVCSVVSAPWGAALAHRWPTRYLARIFALLLAVVAVRIAWRVLNG
jgi:uncharacterized membrane protein YfcA